MTSVAAAWRSSMPAYSRTSAFACSVSSGSTANRLVVMNAIIERVARARQQRAIRHRRQRRDESRQHPEGEQQRHADVADEIDLEALELVRGSACPPRPRRSRTRRIGVSATTKLVAFETALRIAVRSTSSSACLRP